MTVTSVTLTDHSMFLNFMGLEGHELAQTPEVICCRNRPWSELLFLYQHFKENKPEHVNWLVQTAQSCISSLHLLLFGNSIFSCRVFRVLFVWRSKSTATFCRSLKSSSDSPLSLSVSFRQIGRAGLLSRSQRLSDHVTSRSAAAPHQQPPDGRNAPSCARRSSCGRFFSVFSQLPMERPTQKKSSLFLKPSSCG